MTPREWANEIRAARFRRDDEITRDYQAAVLVSNATWGKLPPLHTLLSRAHGLTMQLSHLSEHLGVSFRKASPETIAALERLKVHG